MISEITYLLTYLSTHPNALSLHNLCAKKRTIINCLLYWKDFDTLLNLLLFDSISHETIELGHSIQIRNRTIKEPQ